jgi:hypothetical protein
MREDNHIFLKNGSEIFCDDGEMRRISLKRLAKKGFSAPRDLMAAKRTKAGGRAQIDQLICPSGKAITSSFRDGPSRLRQIVAS